MAWCVEKQKSWTSEDPKYDRRSVRIQVGGAIEDYHHMEPVLCRKEDLGGAGNCLGPYPKNSAGQTLWEGSDYAVVAVIKIHFQPETIKVGGPETTIIKRLSRALGTELLSYQLKQETMEAIQQLAEDKFNACNILADALRNAITKSGLIISLIKLELGFLREQWESIVLDKRTEKEIKRRSINALNRCLISLSHVPADLKEELLEAHSRFLGLYLPPEKGENWIRMRIGERWEELFKQMKLPAAKKKEVEAWIAELKRSLYLGTDSDILNHYLEIPDNLKAAWTSVVYRDLDRLDFEFLDELIDILANPSLNLPHQEKSRKSLIRLKALAEVMEHLEMSTNDVLRRVLNGSENGMIAFNTALVP
jgi:hypothetical protein